MLRRLVFFFFVLSTAHSSAQSGPAFLRDALAKDASGDTITLRSTLFPGPSSLRNDSTGVFYLHLAQANWYFIRDKKTEGITLSYRAIGEAERLHVDSLKGLAAYRLGMFYYARDILGKALQQLNQYILLYPENLHSSEQVEVHRSIALINSYLGNIDESMRFNRWVLKAAIAQKNNRLEGSSYNNIGVTWLKAGKIDSAEVAFTNALALFKLIDYQVGTGQVTNNLGTVAFQRGRYDEALTHYREGLRIRELAKAPLNAVIESNINIGKTCFKLGKNAEAAQWLEKGFTMSDYPDGLELHRRAAEQLKDLYSSMGNYKKAYEMQQVYYAAQDSLYGLQKREEVIRLSLARDLEQQERNDSLKRKQQELLFTLQREKTAAVTAAQQQKNSVIMFAMLIGLLLLGGISFVLFRSYRNKQRDNNIIAGQRDALHEKQKAISDSIAYAKQLQEALFPPQAQIEELLPDSFIFYRPKDVVAGDFYWVEALGPRVFFAAADCTGHGVPGAMVSVVCSNALNRAVKELGLTDPAAILDKASELVMETFEKSTHTVRDGMDISLCCWEKETRTLHWAGANNPLLIIRKENNESLLLDADGQPVGRHEQRKPFTSHTLAIQAGDMIYLFTDGFADQFGGDKGKKFKSANLRKLLTGLCDRPVKEQHEILALTFDEWRGDLEQVDDVCVIGVRVGQTGVRI